MNGVQILKCFYVTGKLPVVNMTEFLVYCYLD